MKSDPLICARCAAHGATCCRIGAGQEEACFPLSDMEMDRIRPYAPAQGWFAQEPNTKAFRAMLDRLFPGEIRELRAIFHPRKSHYRLAVGPDGACVFLSARGCRLPTEARPYYCRLFPVWISGQELLVLGAQCLALREAMDMDALLTGIGLTPAKARDLHSRMRLAWGLAPRQDMPPAAVTYARTK